MPTESNKNLCNTGYYRTCECGSIIAYRNISKHKRTKKHIDCIENSTEYNEFSLFIRNCASIQ